jgi:hypothetical protein
MARKARSNYIEAAFQILTELGGGPLSSKDLVKIAQERGLVGTTTYVYHNFLRKVRDSSLFDTSIRGQISLLPEGETVVAEPMTAPLAGAPAAVISEILSSDIPGTENALNSVEAEEIDPDEPSINEY